MRPGCSVLTSALAVAWFVAASPTCPLAQETHPIPHELLADHARIQQRMRALSHRPGEIGASAKQVLAVLVPHDQREESFVLPLLALLEQLAADRVRPDMAWALPMADKLNAEEQRLYDEHSAIINAVNALAAAGRKQHDAKVVEFAEDIASDEVNDAKVIYPAAILVGKYLREKLPAAR